MTISHAYDIIETLIILEVDMARSEAQRAADKRYREKHPKTGVSWGTYLKPEDAAELDALLKQTGKGRAEFLRWAMEQLKKTTDTEPGD